MRTPLVKQHMHGTHRLITPEASWESLAPHLSEIGITRCADVTWLDRLGLPVFCAVAPTLQILQVTAGKGFTPMAARVSAAMEAYELYCAERTPESLRHASFESLAKEPLAVIDPRGLPGFRDDFHVSPTVRLPWVVGEELMSQTRVQLPAACAHWLEPMHYRWSTNGLASGNHVVEATLHALYEVIERDALARLKTAQGLQRPLRFVAPASMEAPDLRELQKRIAAAGLRLVLARVQSLVPTVHVYWALLLDDNPLSFSTLINAGYGAHTSPTIAALRAITEAAQSRSSMIHASREDLTKKHAYESDAAARRAFEYFSAVQPDLDFATQKDFSSADLWDDYDLVLYSLSRVGVTQVFRVEMTRAPMNIPVVKILVPGLLFDPAWT